MYYELGTMSYNMVDGINLKAIKYVGDISVK
jgi:hypothetical protein